MAQKTTFSQALIVRSFEEVSGVDVDVDVVGVIIKYPYLHSSFLPQLRIGAYPMFAGVLNSTLDRYVVSFLPNIGVGVYVLGGSLGGGGRGGEEGFSYTLDSDMFWKVAFVLTEVRGKPI